MPDTYSGPSALSVAQAAAQLGVGVPTLRRMIARRQIAHCRLNRRVTLLAGDIAAYIAAHRVPAVGELASKKRPRTPKSDRLGGIEEKTL